MPFVWQSGHSLVGGDEGDSGGEKDDINGRNLLTTREPDPRTTPIALAWILYFLSYGKETWEYLWGRTRFL